VLALAVGTLLAQQDEGPVLRPRTSPKPVAKPVAAATLLVLCDLDCNWKLDGKTQGRIAAASSVTVTVSPGQHLVVATTNDGLDRVQKIPETRAGAQAVASIELQPVRDARLKAEQEAREKAERAATEKAAQEARDRAAREQQEKERAEQEIDARDEAAGFWTDPATGLIWTKRDNARDTTRQEAVDYCRNLRLAGHSDWRLPTIKELTEILDQSVDVLGQCCSGLQVIVHVKGRLHISGEEWSESLEGEDSGRARFFSFHDGSPNVDPVSFSGSKRALCVRRSNE
jgi:hypothetical protein